MGFDTCLPRIASPCRVRFIRVGYQVVVSIYIHGKDTLVYKTLISSIFLETICFSLSPIRMSSSHEMSEKSDVTLEEAESAKPSPTPDEHPEVEFSLSIAKLLAILVSHS